MELKTKPPPMKLLPLRKRVLLDTQLISPAPSPDPPPTEVFPFLYIGSSQDSNDVEMLRKLQIGYILSVTASCPEMDSRTEEFKKLHIPVSDNHCENLAPHFDTACEFIDEAKKTCSKILIHCDGGVSRSPTFAIAYVMKYYNLSTHEAYDFVKNVRRIISPNLNFMGQLLEFESKLKGVGGVGNTSENESSMESSSSIEES